MVTVWRLQSGQQRRGQVRRWERIWTHVSPPVQSPPAPQGEGCRQTDGERDEEREQNRGRGTEMEEEISLGWCGSVD